MMVYRLSGVTKEYDDKVVLNIDSLEINKGGIYALLGPNGAGKTTLLKILGFLELPTRGDILYCSKPVIFSEPFLQPIRKKVVVVNQHPVLFTTTVHKNLEFGLKVRNIEKAKREKIINETLELMSIQHLAKAPAHRLSGGETRRVALARALALSPEVILCDELTAGVDIENQAAIINILKEINEHRQVTLIITTHDRLQAASIAQHTLFLNRGELARSSYENLFFAEISGNNHGFSQCVIQNTISLTIPTKKTGKVRLTIDPEKIRAMPVSNRKDIDNCFDGRVVQVIQEREKIRIIADFGIRLSLLLCGKDYRALRPMVGEQVKVVIEPEAIKIL